jgi:AcrR family transcriptional regulator
VLQFESVPSRDAKKAQRIPRGTLTAERIVEVACELAAQVGIAEFSMPQVAREMGVGVTSIYWHFRNRDELLAAIANRTTQEFYAGLDYGQMEDVEDTVLQYFRMYWQRLRENQLWREIFISHARQTLLSSRSAMTRSLAIRETEIDRMTGAGMTRSEGFRAYAILSAYTRGFVVLDRLTHLDYRLDDRLPVFEEDPLIVHPEELFERGLRSIWRGLLAESFSH